jgi:hypothetical protein
MASRSPKRRRKPNPPPAQAAIWPQRFAALARVAGRFAPNDRSGEIVRTAVRLTGRKLRDGWFDTSSRPAIAARIDPAAAVLIACERIARLIGRPEPHETPDAPAWIHVDRAAPVPVVRIIARGATIQGERISRQLVGGRVVAADQTTGVQRMFSLDALKEAAGVARAALAAAGIMLSTFGEVRATRQGGVAVIGLRRVSTPVLAPAF